MAVTDLTGTTWVFNGTFPPHFPNKGEYYTEGDIRGLTPTSEYGYFIDFIFIWKNGSGEYNCNYIYNFNYDAGTTIGVATYPNGTEHYFEGTMTITGGTDATNTDLISWLQSNATLQVTDIVVNSTTLETTLHTAGKYCDKNILVKSSDRNLVAENIKKDVSIFGITGSYEGVANQNPYIATTATEMAQYLASKYYGSVVKYTGTTGTYTQNRLYKVIQATSNKYTFEELITPVGSTTKTENGTYDVKEYAEVVVNVPIGITPSGKKEITNTSEVDVTNYATAQVVDSDLTANNIRKGVNILGVTGTLQEGITPSGSVTINSNGTVDVTNYASAVVNVPTYITVASESELPTDSADGTIAIVGE